MIIFLASHYGNAWVDIRHSYRNVIRCGNDRGEMVNDDGSRTALRVVIREQQLQGLRPTEIVQLPHARISDRLRYEAEMTRDRFRGMVAETPD